jgi:hypothetical protein
MKHLVEIELGIVEIAKAKWSYVDQYGDLRYGEQEHITFLTAEGELKEFSTYEEWFNTLPANVKSYHIGHIHHDHIGHSGYRFETRDTGKITLVL